MNKKIVLILLVSILSGLIAVSLLHRYIKGEREKLRRKANYVSVLFAKGDINPGGKIMGRDLKRGELPRRRAEEIDAVSPKDAARIIGASVRSRIKKGTAILWPHIIAPYKKRGGLANSINADKKERAISLRVDIVSSVTGLVEPDDRVDILGTFAFPSKEDKSLMKNITITILQNVTILATGKNTARKVLEERSGRRRNTRGGGGYSTVTVAVTPQEAEMLVFAQQIGKLTLSLRNPLDPYMVDDLKSIDFDYIKDNIREFNEERKRREGIK
jgi:pilus assembly protein CpaB